MVSIIWLESANRGKPEKVDAIPILDENDDCVGILFTGLPPNVEFQAHLDVDENTFDGSAYINTVTDQKGVSHVPFHISR